MSGCLVGCYCSLSGSGICEFNFQNQSIAFGDLDRLLISDTDFRILVDPASCHMLVSKIKPCMSKYTLWHSETANGSLNQLWFIRSCVPMWITVVILELIHATGPDFIGRTLLLDQNQSGSPVVVMTLDNFVPTAWP